MVKLMFMMFKKPGLDRDASVEMWTGEQHLDLVRPMQALGVEKYVQNRVTSPEPEGAPDGFGEFWFSDDEAMQRVMSSPEMGAAFEDAERFADLEKGHALAVDESPVIG